MKPHLLVFTLLTLAPAVNAEGDPLKLKYIGITGELSYTGEWLSNTRGGLKTGTAYDGSLDLALTLDTRGAGLWDNGAFFLSAFEHHDNGKLTADYAGDLQTVSNLEAPRGFRVYELWYEHRFFNDRLSALAGLHDFNADFNVTENGQLFLNSSFGIAPDLSANARPSIYPMASFGTRLIWKLTDQFTLLSGVYDGNPGDPDTERHFSKINFSSSNGTLIANEIQWQAFEKTIIKAGQWINTGVFTDLIDTDSEDTPLNRRNNYGYYLVMDHQLWSDGVQKDIAGFVQAGWAPDHLNEVDYYTGAGLVFSGFVPGRNSDSFGIAAGRASISDALRSVSARDHAETSLELTYQARISERLSLQPDLQYIINPGAEPGRKNALIAGMRFNIVLY